jgi:hypothetical protein
LWPVFAAFLRIRSAHNGRISGAVRQMKQLAAASSRVSTGDVRFPLPAYYVSWCCGPSAGIALWALAVMVVEVAGGPGLAFGLSGALFLVIFGLPAWILNLVGLASLYRAWRVRAWPMPIVRALLVTALVGLASPVFVLYAYAAVL